MYSAEHLAERFADAIAARWRGGANDDSFVDWLEAHWTVDCSHPEPPDPPQAVSLLGGMPAVRWHQYDDAIVGHVVGRPGGCYWVPRRDPRPAA
ncbi:MAG: hypothetical protein IT337_13190 [Thermomicrobiales bacterium]|nr:hypothetical protein [Thermomicrobiales bacterium]